MVPLRRLSHGSGGWMKQGSSWYYLRLRRDADRLAEQGAAPGNWLDPESGRMATGWAKASDGKWYYFGLRRPVKAAPAAGWKPGLLPVLPLRLRGDADGLAEQGRLLVLAGTWTPARWADVLMYRLGRRPRTASGTTSEGSGAMQSSRWLETRNRLVLPERIGSHANRLVAHGEELGTGWIPNQACDEWQAGSRTEGHGTALTSSGAMATGTAVIDGTRYIFDDSGACADFVDE